MDIFDFISDKNNNGGYGHVFDYLKSDDKKFVDFVQHAYGSYFISAGLIADIDENRLLEAYVFWKNDLERIKKFEMSDSEELDHFKHAAHMIYWLRRAVPVLSVQPAEEGSTPDEILQQDLLYKYRDQYCAFDLGFKLCAFFEANRPKTDKYFSEYNLDYDFKSVASHFLKTKNVSPHALFLIYKGLFFDPFKRKVA